MLRNNPVFRSFQEVYNVSKALYIWNYVLTLVQGITNAIPIIFLQIFFDGLVNALSGDENWKSVIFSFCSYLGIMVFSHLIKGVTDYNYEYYDLKVAYAMVNKTNKKAGDLSPHVLEDVYTQDAVNKAYDGTKRVRIIVDTIMLLALYYFPEVVVIVVYLYRANPFLPLVVFFVLIAIIVPEFFREKYYTNAEELTANLSRKIDEYSGYISDLRHCGETRILELCPKFISMVEDSIQKRNRIMWDCFWKSCNLEIIEKLFSLSGRILTASLLYICMVNGSISIGTFAAVLTSIDNLFALLTQLVNLLSGGISETLGKVKCYLNVQDMPTDAQPSMRLGDLNSITLEHVSFSYPSQSINAVEDINLTLTKGEHIAIVGENGAGKTTLVRLLSGLYFPTSGNVKYNGRSSIEAKNDMSAVFQNFGRYHLSVAENIHISDISSTNKLSPIVKDPRFFLASEKSIDMDTMLSREFGGIELSGGQWQQLAIARGFYRRCGWIFLDEPTSAIDPIHEGDIVNLVHSMDRNKTSITITHRLSSIRFADRIIVMKNGRIVGFDSHESLMEKCLEYQEIWKAQMENLV